MPVGSYAEILNLESHWRAQTLVTGGLSDGDPVTAWNDETGTRHFHTPIDPPVVGRPNIRENVIGSRPAVRFGEGGVGDGLDNNTLVTLWNSLILGSAEFTIYIVYKQNSTETDALLGFRDGGGFNRSEFRVAGNNASQGISSPGSGDVENVGLLNQDDDANVLIIDWDGSVSTCYDRHGLILASPSGRTWASAANCHLGHVWGPSGPGNFYVGDIFVMAIASSKHSDTHRQEVADFLYFDNASDPSDANVTQAFAEVLAQEAPEARVTQATLEVIAEIPADWNVTQAFAEPLIQPETDVAVTQAFLEVLTSGACEDIEKFIPTEFVFECDEPPLQEIADCE